VHLQYVAALVSLSPVRQQHAHGAATGMHASNNTQLGVLHACQLGQHMLTQCQRPINIRLSQNLFQTCDPVLSSTPPYATQHTCVFHTMITYHGCGSPAMATAPRPLSNAASHA
jgi:hypothetical protein